MKKFKRFSLLLSLLLLLQCPLSPLSAAAAQTGAASDSTQESTEAWDAIVETEPIPFGQVSIRNGCRTIEGMSPLAGTERKVTTAQAAFLYEMNTGTVVYSYNPDLKVAPGSLAKLVNAAVVLEHCKLDEKVITTSDINRRPAGSIHSGLKVEEELTVEDLLHCMLLAGGNDAAIALADHVAGNQTSFVTLMNAWVIKIGCTGTEFGNVHGLDNATSTTTARDMAKILMAAMEDEELKTILSALSYEVPETNKNKKHGFRTTNYMIDKGTIEDFYDTRVKGGLASFVKAYGASLVVWATDKKESQTDDQTAVTVSEVADNSMQYIGVVLGCTRTFRENGWSVISYGNYNEMTDLMKLGFNSYKVNRIVYDGMAMGQFTVAGGECNAVGQAEVNIDSVVPINAQMDNLYMNFSVANGSLAAPIARDELIATVQIKYRDCVMAEAEVYAAGNVYSAGGNGVSIRSTALKNSSGGSGVLSTIGTICVILLGLVAAYLAFNSYMRNRARARRRKRRAERRRNY